MSSDVRPASVHVRVATSASDDLAAAFARLIPQLS